MKDLNLDNFKVFISKGDSVVDFWAPWCGPCKMLGPIFEEVSKEIRGVAFAKVNVDDAEEVAMDFGVRGVPTMIFFKDGKEVHRLVGFLSKDVLKSQVKEVFQ